MVGCFLLLASLLGLAAPAVDAAPAPALAWREVAGGRVAPVTVTPGGRAGFAEMTPERTGVRFVNALDDRLIMGNNNFMSGSGVALGDFDGDGWCDLYFCAIDGTNALYRNLGDWRFEDVTARSGAAAGSGAWHSTGAAFADIDGDGDLDLLVNTLGQGTHCFANEGGGRFRDATAEAGLTSRTGSLGLALGDVDGDGDLDLYVANYGEVAILRAGGRAEMKKVNGQWEIAGPYADRLRVVEGRLEEVGEPDVLYRNDGRGHFQAVPWNSEWFRDERGNAMPAPWDFGLGVQIRDINEDGFPDIYVCNDFQTVDRVWINDGLGRFRLLSKLSMRQQSYASMGVDFADIDRDGRLDFFVVEMMSREHGRRMRQLVGFQPDYRYPGFFDNRPEAARNTLFWNRGDGTYAEIAHFAGVEASEWSWQPVFLDVDLDGYEDILVANGNAFDVQDRDVLARVRALGRQTPEQTRTNILLYPRLDTPNAAFRNRGDRTFEESGNAWNFNSRRISHGIALADLDHDGDQDVVVNTLYGAPLILRNDSSAPRVMVRLRGRTGNAQGIGARVRALGGAVPSQSQEIVCGGRYLAGDDPARTFAAGTAPALTLEVSWRSGVRSILTNIPPNTVCEIDEPPPTTAPPTPRVSESPAPLFAEAGPAFQHSHREEIFDDYGRQPLLPWQLSQLGPGIGWFDLDGNGHEDLLIGAGKGGQLAVFSNDGGGALKRLPVDGGPFPDDSAGLAAWTTANGGRRLLCAVSNYENPGSNGLQLMAWTLDSATRRATPTRIASVPGIDSSPGPLAVADYDGDGDLDVFVGGRVRPGAYPFSAASMLFRQDNGGLIPDERNRAILSEIGLVSGAIWTDLEADGAPELVLACEWGPIRVFRSDKGVLVERTRELGLAEWTGLWNSIAAADVDGDGRMDLIAGNHGLNSPYRATVAQPIRLYYGDLGGRGVVDLVEAYAASGLNAVAPRRNLSVLAQAIPSLPAFYPTHRSFGAASIPDIFGHLQVHPPHVAAVMLASTVFLNRGDRFEPRALPGEAQFSPVYGIVPADFDGDGRMDLALAQNQFVLRPDLSRLDAGRGLLLRGAGAGRFEPMPGRESGIVVHGEQRGIAAADYDEDGRMDFAVSQNGAATKLFRNIGGRPGYRIRLTGPPANPEAIGAVVRLRTAAGLGPAWEIHAGAGYWSQDTVIPVLSTPESEPALGVWVRWPGGTVFEQPLPAGTREVRIKNPGAGL